MSSAVTDCWNSDRFTQRLSQLNIPAHVRLVAVSKTFPAEAIRAAYGAGIRNFGENKVQEAIDKQAELADLQDITWHFIGHLQTNKARKAIQHFDWIHSVDSLKLAKRLDRLAAELDKSPVSCLQIKLRSDTNKYGFSQAELQTALGELHQLQHLQLQGIMAIPPLGLDPSETSSLFQEAYDLGQMLANHAEFPLPIQYYSMGMSQDFPLAIAAGANIIRLGTTLFGHRQ